VTSVVATSTSPESTDLRCFPTVSRTTSTFALARPSDVATSIDVYDVSGRLVRRLSLAAGSRSVEWDGRANSGNAVASGAYLARWTDATNGATAATARVIRIR
jgi:flagellar hook assembly protein FlgD